MYLFIFILDWFFLGGGFIWLLIKNQVTVLTRFCMKQTWELRTWELSIIFHDDIIYLCIFTIVWERIWLLSAIFSNILCSYLYCIPSYKWLYRHVMSYLITRLNLVDYFLLFLNHFPWRYFYRVVWSTIHVLLHLSGICMCVCKHLNDPITKDMKRAHVRW